MKDEEIEFTISSGNIFADLGITNPEEHLKKAELISDISRWIKQTGIKKKHVAMLFDVSVAELNGILRGRFRNIAWEELRDYWNLLKKELEE